VLLRPIAERTLLPTAAYMAGPNEITYFAQVSAVAPALGVDVPLSVPRWSGVIIEPHVERILARYGVAYEELRDPHAVEKRLVRERLPSAVAAALERDRPSARAAFARRARAYEAKLRRLDAQIHACFHALPASRLRLVTDHDAFGYFARRYGLRVIGAVIPSQTTQAQPSARELTQLADLVRRERVPSIFPETSLSPKLARTIARETGAAAGLSLYGDTLGPAGSSGDTYLKMEGANARAIALGLSGGSLRCRVDVR
jgi:ABC-type Zn uptake system ZnuABC Zn-binding protein ZnuA